MDGLWPRMEVALGVREIQQTHRKLFYTKKKPKNFIIKRREGIILD